MMVESHKYMEFLEYHATKIYDKDRHNEFMYHDKEDIIKDLESNFSKGVAKDIYDLFLQMAREEGFLNDSDIQ